MKLDSPKLFQFSGTTFLINAGNHISSSSMLTLNGVANKLILVPNTPHFGLIFESIEVRVKIMRLLNKKLEQEDKVIFICLSKCLQTLNLNKYK